MPIIHCFGCIKNGVYPLKSSREDEKGGIYAADSTIFRDLSEMPVATEIFEANNEKPLFMLESLLWHPIAQDCQFRFRQPLLKALENIPERTIQVEHYQKRNYSLAVITLSDKGTEGLRQDKSGPEIIAILRNCLSFSLVNSWLIPDDAQLLKALVTDLACNQCYDLILTTGGTGIGKRDITPQTISPLLDLELPGFAQAMMSASLQETSNGMLSRALAGLINHSLVINLPGSVKAVRCNLKAILPALAHALKKASGDDSDCGGN